MCSNKLVYLSALLSLAFLLIASPHRPLFAGAKEGSVSGEYSLTVIVVDAASNSPVQNARVTLYGSAASFPTALTNAVGRATISEVPPGRYKLSVYQNAFEPFSDSVTVDETHSVDSVMLFEKTYKEQAVVVTESRDVSASSVNTKTGNQVFESELYHAAPTARITDLVQQNLAGAARAPTGEVHIRGQHGEYTYYIDGVPVPLGVFGGLNEVVDAKVIDHATFWTGGFPAEYGGQIAAVVDIQNRVPTGQFHVDFSTYGGGYTYRYVKSSPYAATDRVGPINASGQSLSFSDHAGKFGYFLSGSRDVSDRRIDNPTPSLFNDHGTDYFVYGKLDYLLGDKDYLTMNLNYGKTNTQVPFDTTDFAGALAPDNQKTTNSFQTLSYFHTISTEKDRESNFFAGAFVREGGLIYTPSSVSPATFQFAGDSNFYALKEDRSFVTTGIRTKYDFRVSHHLMFAAGFNASRTAGKENFTSRDGGGSPGPSVVTNFSGSDIGVFGQSEIHPAEWTRFDLGVRYDRHTAPDQAVASQVSPRAKINFFLDESNTLYLYYGRLFLPINIEGLKTIASNASDNTAEPTRPQRDNLFEIGYLRNFSSGWKSKLTFYYKDSRPGVDDATVGASAVKASVNIEKVKTTGLEAGLSYSSPSTPFSGYLNAALIHAYGTGAITGGFLSSDFEGAGSASDLDHDQRLSIAMGLNYQPRNWFANLTGIYGSGLTNGNPNDIPFKTGLFDFNSDAHVKPSVIFNLSGGYTFHLSGKATLEPSLYISNVLDNDYLLKGAYFSGAAFGERRKVILKIAVHV